MPELVLQKNAPEKASIAYGNQYLKDDYLSDSLYASAWERAPKLQQTTQKLHYSPTAAVNQETYGTLIRDWFEKKSPLTQTDLLDCEETEIQELIFRIRRLPVIPWGSLANRLLVLYNDAKEEDADSPGIALGSIRHFYNFLQFHTHTNLKCPIISLTPDNNIYASWKEGRNRVFSVHFLPRGDVRFVIFKPNNKHPERQIRVSGTATTDTLMEMVTPNGLWDWIVE